MTGAKSETETGILPTGFEPDNFIVCCNNLAIPPLNWCEVIHFYGILSIMYNKAKDEKRISCSTS